MSEAAILEQYGISVAEFAICIATGIAVAAFGIWLTVRLVNRRERWAKRIAIAFLIALVVYPLSWGPAMYLYQSNGRPRWGEILLHVYSPLAVLLDSGRPWFLEPYRRYIFGCMVDDPPQSSVNPPAPNPDGPAE